MSKKQCADCWKMVDEEGLVIVSEYPYDSSRTICYDCTETLKQEQASHE